jgi:hypothetical protein
VLKDFSEREKEMVVIGEIVDPADIKTYPLRAADFIGRLVEQFHSEREIAGNFAFQYPTRKPEVFIAWAGINPKAAAAKGRPVTNILLQPERNERVGPAGA